jgi:hypothetical protein
MIKPAVKRVRERSPGLIVNIPPIILARSAASIGEHLGLFPSTIIPQPSTNFRPSTISRQPENPEIP